MSKNFFDLKNCPCCENNNAVIGQDKQTSDFVIICPNCGKKTKPQNTIYDAIVEWNIYTTKNN